MGGASAAHLAGRHHVLRRLAGSCRHPCALAALLSKRDITVRLSGAAVVTRRCLSGRPSAERDQDLWIPARRGAGRAGQCVVAGGGVIFYFLRGFPADTASRASARPGDDCGSSCGVVMNGVIALLLWRSPRDVNVRSALLHEVATRSQPPQCSWEVLPFCGRDNTGSTRHCHSGSEP